MSQKPFIIGICGGSGSGKSTLASSLVDIIGSQNVLIICQDSYYRDISHKSEDERAASNFDHPDSIEWELLIKHLDDLCTRKQIQIPHYDFITHSRTGYEIARPYDYIILEGHLIFNNESIRNRINLKVYLKHDIDILFIRRLQRDTVERGRTFDQIVRQYIDTVRPMYLSYVEPSSQWADLMFISDFTMDDCLKEIVSYLEIDKN